MTALATLNPIGQFFGLDGSPLDAGRLYFGQANQNPVTAPVAVYWDAAATQPAAQPIATLNGFPVRSGTPAIVYAATDYSLLVQDARGRQVLYAPNSADFGNAATIVGQVTALRADLADTSDATKGAAMLGRAGQVVGSIAALRLLIKTSASKQAIVTGYYASGDGGGGPYYYDAADTTSTDNGGTVIVASDGGRWKLCHQGTLSVRQFGAKGDGTTDDTAAIAAADAAACSGALGLDGVTVIAQAKVHFPAGRYKVTGLTYRGAPWFGDGIATTFVNMYASSGACVDALGTNTARKQLSIRDMTFNGSNATGTAYGLKIGYNQRSFGALQRVRFDFFPGQALNFDSPTWIMSFYDVYISRNANGVGSVGTAIYHNPAIAEGELLAIDWFNLHLENNGYTTSGKGGGMDLTSNAVFQWKFWGGVWEGNYGDSEAAFDGCVEIHIDGLYLEAEAASVPNGLVFNNTFGSLTNSRIAGQIGMTGDGVKVSGNSNLVISQILSNIRWVNDISTAGASMVTLGGLPASLVFSVGAGSAILRSAERRVQLTDAVTIATDASLGTSFYVGLNDNRTMGAPTNPSIGQQINFMVTQSALGGHTLAWNAVFKQAWSNTGNTANKRSTIAFEYDGTNWNQLGAQSPYT